MAGQLDSSWASTTTTHASRSEYSEGVGTLACTLGTPSMVAKTSGWPIRLSPCRRLDLTVTRPSPAAIVSVAGLPTGMLLNVLEASTMQSACVPEYAA